MVMSNDSFLSIDAADTAARIEVYLSRLVEENRADGILLGLSGGIDSAVLAALAVRAVGPEKVHAAFLYDRDSEKSSEYKARLVAEFLGIKLEVQDISPNMRRQGVYSPLIMRLVTWSRRFNRMIQHFYCLMFRENPFMSTLKEGCGELEQNPVKRLVYNLTVRHFENGFYERHRYRREVLEQRAKRENLLLIGAANRSEALVGWFVKDGIDDLYYQPMIGLYKTQVWQLADYLALPVEVRNQIPSPDMMLGITDEFGIGVPYRTLDIIFHGLELGMDEEQITAMGPTYDQIRLALELNRLSAWKRESPHAEPPVGSTVFDFYLMKRTQGDGIHDNAVINPSTSGSGKKSCLDPA